MEETIKGGEPMTPQEKARETRQKHAEAQTAMWREQRELLKTAKEAMKRVLENKDATPEQLIRAAEILAELGKH